VLVGSKKAIGQRSHRTRFRWPPRLSQHSADPSGDLIEIPAGCSPLTGIEAEKIPRIAGEHVQMDVENLLTRSLAISEKQVHSLTPQTAAPNSCGQALSNHEHPTTVGLVEVS
jgi:hypothetical protein